MKKSRRFFLKTAGAAGALLPFSICAAADDRRFRQPDLSRMIDDPVLRQDLLREPIWIESVELLRKDRVYLVRIRSKDGLESVTAPNSDRMREAYPVFLQRVAPFFVGKDACRIEQLLEELYRARSNYKLQGLLFWACVAAVEMGVLDLIGMARAKSIGELFGPILRREIAVYRASGNRGNRPDEEVEHLRKLVAETGAKAIKFRLGGRMSRNMDSRPGRTEALIPLVREAFGPEMTLYADSNSSFDVPSSIRIGRLMEEHRYAFFEEPVPFDQLWETKDVADRLVIPIAGGEQECSMRRFRWMIENRGVDIVQPDLHYFGGYIRCTKVARMAAAVGMQCTPHMSGSGVGYVNVLHFASYTPNVGPYQEFKGESNVPTACETSTLQCKNGVVRCPSGPGMGVSIDPDYVRQAQVVLDS